MEILYKISSVVLCNRSNQADKMQSCNNVERLKLLYYFSDIGLTAGKFGCIIKLILCVDVKSKNAPRKEIYI